MASTSPVVDADKPTNIDDVIPELDDDASGSGSDESTDSESSEGETSDVPNDRSPKSRDGDDKDGQDGSPKNDPDASTSAGIPVESGDVKTTFEDGEIEEMFQKALESGDEADMKKFLKIASLRCKYYYDKASGMKSALNKIYAKKRREKKALEKKEEMKAKKDAFPDFITLNIAFGGKMFSIRATPDTTLRGIRSLLHLTYGKEIPAENKLKRYNFMYKGQVMNEHSRRTCLTIDPNKSGWGIQDGDIITVSIGGAGGATKRSSATSSMDKTEEKIRALEDELNTGFMRGEMSEFPIVKEAMTYLKDIYNNVKNKENFTLNFIDNLPLETLKKVQSASMTTNQESKLNTMGKLAFVNAHGKLVECQRQLMACERNIKALFHFMVLKQFMADDTGNIQWQLLNKHLVDEIADKTKSTDSAM